MFISWGTKGTSTNLGYAADFCPVCRSVQQFRIIRVGTTSHVYGMALGKGDLVGHNRECGKCGVVLGANPVNYKELAKRSGKQSMDSLIQTTFPNIRTHHAERFRLEEFLANHPDKLDAALRSKLIAEPFQLLEHVVQARFAQTSIDIVMVAIMIVTILVCAQVTKVAQAVPSLADSVGTMILLTFVGGGVALFMQGRRAGNQFMRRKIYPSLVSALQPLRPNEAEIRSVLAMLSRSKATMAKKVRLPELAALLKVSVTV